MKIAGAMILGMILVGVAVMLSVPAPAAHAQECPPERLRVTTWQFWWGTVTWTQCVNFNENVVFRVNRAFVISGTANCDEFATDEFYQYSYEGHCWRNYTYTVGNFWISNTLAMTIDVDAENETYVGVTVFARDVFLEPAAYFGTRYVQNDFCPPFGIAARGEFRSGWCGSCRYCETWNSWTSDDYDKIVLNVINYEDTDQEVAVDAVLYRLSPLSEPPAPPAPPAVLPQLDQRYFQPYEYDRNAPSPLRGVRIDMYHVTRSVVTVYQFFSERGYLAWIAAFAIIYVILSAFISFLIRKFRGSG